MKTRASARLLLVGLASFILLSGARRLGAVDVWASVLGSYPSVVQAAPWAGSHTLSGQAFDGEKCTRSPGFLASTAGRTCSETCFKHGLRPTHGCSESAVPPNCPPPLPRRCCRAAVS